MRKYGNKETRKWGKRKWRKQHCTQGTFCYCSHQILMRSHAISIHVRSSLPYSWCQRGMLGHHITISKLYSSMCVFHPWHPGCELLEVCWIFHILCYNFLQGVIWRLLHSLAFLWRCFSHTALIFTTVKIKCPLQNACSRSNSRSMRHKNITKRWLLQVMFLCS